MKVFEKTFAIEDLEEIVKAVTGKLKSGQEYNPSKGMYAFD